MVLYLIFSKQKNLKILWNRANRCLQRLPKKTSNFEFFFEKQSAEKFKKKYGKPDVIIFTNVFAHIENLKKL